MENVSKKIRENLIYFIKIYIQLCHNFMSTRCFNYHKRNKICKFSVEHSEEPVERNLIMTFSGII